MNKIVVRAVALALAAVMLLGLLAGIVMADEYSQNQERYSSAEFEAEYTYQGDDLGAVWSPASTTFRLWAPTASYVAVNIYESGTPDAGNLKQYAKMEKDVKGTWTVTVAGDLNGMYYTYQVNVDGMKNEVCDPYARAVGVNGRRAMIIDLDSTDPEGWENDTDPHYNNYITDDVIYELHIRDLSSDGSSGIQNAGKYLGLTEKGTTNADGVPTGLDHIINLGVTHVHLMPCYDFASVDETTLEENDYSWGYDPVNYNVPEGSYSTDPRDGAVRVSEFKQMVKTLHDNGISVIMDVSYDHVYNAQEFCFNQAVPGYFTRITTDGVYSNGSACGNDTASERSMVKKYIVDSVTYWADEYHIDGFCFDKAGLLDTETISACIEAVQETHPNVIFYGDGQELTTDVTKEGYTMASQSNSTQMSALAYFSDVACDTIRGSDSDAGFVTGGSSAIADIFQGKSTWCKNPIQTINYVSGHDGYTLFDSLTLSTQDKTEAERIRMNNLAAAVVLTSQGVPFFQAGEEMLRSKPTAEGFEHNSFDSSDEINSIKWSNLSNEAYGDVVDYYAGLIAFRKAHPALRMTTAEEVESHITQLSDLEPNVAGAHISAGANGEKNEIIAIFNPLTTDTEVTLPEGEWTVYIDGANAGTKPLSTVEDTVTVAAISACVMVKEVSETEDAVEIENAEPSELLLDLPAIIAAALAVVSGVCIVVLLIIKQKMK